MAVTNWYALHEKVTAEVRAGGVIEQTAQGHAIIFNPPLNTTEQAAFDDLMKMERLGVTADLTLAEFRAVKPDLAGIRAYVGVATPTTAQKDAALKAAIRVILALVKS